MATCPLALGNRGERVFTDYNVEFSVDVRIFGRRAGYAARPVTCARASPGKHDLKAFPDLLLALVNEFLKVPNLCPRRL